MVTLKQLSQQLPRGFLLALLIASATALGACEKEGAAEKAGKKIDATAEFAEKKAGETVEAAKGAFEDAEEEAKEATK